MLKNLFKKRKDVKEEKIEKLELEVAVLELKVSQLLEKAEAFEEKAKTLSQEIEQLREVYNAVNIAFTEQRRSRYTQKLKSLLHSYPDVKDDSTEVSSE
jgi:chromosome segregation ATPase